MITYTRAVEAIKGQCITSTQWNKLASAFNDRLLNGVADCTWRLWWRASSLVRQICQSEGTSASMMDEYWRFWNLTDPRAGQSQFECWSGEATENPINPMVVYTHGNEDEFGLEPEDARVGFAPAFEGRTSDYYWNEAKGQRGAAVPNGAWNAPAYSAARSHFNISYMWALAPYLKGYGGFFPVALRGSAAFGVDWSGWADFTYDQITEWANWSAWEQRCGADDTPDRSEEEYGMVPTIYIFSPLRQGLDPIVHIPKSLESYTYDEDGECFVFNPLTDPASDQFMANWKSVQYAADRYIITRVNGQSFELLYTDYVEGPYGSGGWLEWGQADILSEAMQFFADDFKGAASQRSDRSCNVDSVGWRHDSFFGSQYTLAPTYGVDGTEGIVADYPSFGHPGTFASGTFLPCAYMEASHGNQYDIHAGYVFGGYYAKATGLVDQSVTLAFMDAATEPPVELHRFTLTGSEPDKLHYFPIPPGSEPKIKVQIVSTTTDGAGVALTVEIAELMEMKGEMYDAALVLRLGTTRGSGAGAIDTCGIDYTTARQKSDEFARYGCIINDSALPAMDTQPVMRHPYFDNMRRLFRENFRYIDRDFPSFGQSLMEYAVVNENEVEKSVLTFRRYVFYNSEQFDLFLGMAPSSAPVETDAIGPDIEYIIRGSRSITYNGVDYAEGGTFTGVAGVTSFTVNQNGDARPYRVNGINAKAPPRGESNRWSMFQSMNRYSYNGGSWCHTENYGDAAGILSDRCTTLDPLLDPVSGAQDLAQHLGYNAGGVLTENPSGYRYVRGSDGRRLNGNSPSAGFMQSCQIYVPDYVVESVTEDTVTLPSTPPTSVAVVRVKLASRLNHTTAAATYADYGQDGVTGKLTEGGAAPAYRTDENAVMEYLLDDGINTGIACQTLAGDTSIDTDGDDSSACNGACHITWHFTRMIPEVYAESPETDANDAADTKLVARNLQWCHFVLASICEGYIDPKTSTVEACPAGRIGDYTFQRLCMDVAEKAPFAIIEPTLEGTTLTWDDSGGGPFTIQFFDELAPSLGWRMEDSAEASPYTVAAGHSGYDFRVISLQHARSHMLFLPASERPDEPVGFGPISNTCAYADIFNQTVRGINLLTSARIELPLTVQRRGAPFSGTGTWEPTQYGVAPPTCADRCEDGTTVTGLYSAGGEGLSPEADTIAPVPLRIPAEYETELMIGTICDDPEYCYSVNGPGAVNYNGVNYFDGQEFCGVPGVETFTRTGSNTWVIYNGGWDCWSDSNGSVTTTALTLPNYVAYADSDGISCPYQLKTAANKVQLRIDPTLSMLNAVPVGIRDMVTDYPSIYAERYMAISHHTQSEDGTTSLCYEGDVQDCPGCISPQTAVYHYSEGRDCIVIDPDGAGGYTTVESGTPPSGYMQYFNTGSFHGLDRDQSAHFGSSSQVSLSLSLGELALHVPLV